jgi:adenine-specific DNA-methyltransferase
MMYPRLFLAQSLLRRDGFIVVSIDDMEVYNLRRLLNDSFGEENYIATLVWDRNRKNDAAFFSVGHEYMIVYAKDKQYLRDNEVKLRADKEGVDDVRKEFERLKLEHAEDWDAVKAGLKSFFDAMEEDDPRKALSRFNKVDKDGPYRDDGNINWPGGGGPMYEVPHPITHKSVKKPVSGWRYSTKEKFDAEYTKGKIVFGPDETTVPGVRTNLFEKSQQIMKSVGDSYAQTASNAFNELFDGTKVFENPKHFEDLRKIIEYLTDDDDIILDFFAGSASTGHAVYESNRKSLSKRRFICIQLPEPVNTKRSVGKNALRLGMKTVFDVGRERLRRVAERMGHGQSGTLRLGETEDDLGFKWLRLTASNFKIWDPSEASPDAQGLGKQLLAFADNILPGATDEALVFEVMLKAGIDLSDKRETLQIGSRTVHRIGDNKLMLCLEDRVDQATLRAIIDMKPQRVVVLDNAFQGNDQLKTNAALEMKSHDIAFQTL